MHSIKNRTFSPLSINSPDWLYIPGGFLEQGWVSRTGGGSRNRDQLERSLGNKDRTRW